jgi:hypothetical protein
MIEPLFGQRTPAEEKAYIIFAPVGSGEQSLLEKTQANEIEEGTIQVMFDVAVGRIQIMKYDLQKGWLQQGKDIRAKFVDGDRFRAALRENGTVEIYRNGKLLAKRDVTP